MNYPFYEICCMLFMYVFVFFIYIYFFRHENHNLSYFLSLGCRNLLIRSFLVSGLFTFSLQFAIKEKLIVKNIVRCELESKELQVSLCARQIFFSIVSFIHKR